MKKEALELAEREWHNIAIKRRVLGEKGKAQDIDEEAEWIEKLLIMVLNRHAKKLQVCARSKRWWNKEVSEMGAKYKKCRRQFQAQNVSKEALQIERKT